MPRLVEVPIAVAVALEEWGVQIGEAGRGRWERKVGPAKYDRERERERDQGKRKMPEKREGHKKRYCKQAKAEEKLQQASYSQICLFVCMNG